MQFLCKTFHASFFNIKEGKFFNYNLTKPLKGFNAVLKREFSYFPF